MEPFHRYLSQLLIAHPQIFRLIVGYSGGLDSHVLLHGLAMHRPYWLTQKLEAIYVDHGLQTASAAWGEHCAEVCCDLNMPFRVLKIDARPVPGESPEAAARRARYTALAAELGPDSALLTAHHRDDQAETLLLQLLRGTGPHGLAAMPAVSRLGQGWLLRPFLEVDRADDVLRSVLTERGFAIEEDGLVESWLPAESRPPISALHEGYRLLDRSTAADRPHHMIHERRNHLDPEPRLKQTSLYRSDLDLAVYDEHGNVAGYGLCWYDPVSAVGAIEPMRTEDKHQQRGIARHILTSGIDRLARAGATRIKICFEPSNPASGHLYRSAGFEPHRQNDIFVGPTGVGPGEETPPEALCSGERR